MRPGGCPTLSRCLHLRDQGFVDVLGALVGRPCRQARGIGLEDVVGGNVLNCVPQMTCAPR